MILKSSVSLTFNRFRHVDSEYDIVKSDLVIDSGFPKKNLIMLSILGSLLLSTCLLHSSMMHLDICDPKISRC